MNKDRWRALGGPGQEGARQAQHRDGRAQGLPVWLREWLSRPPGDSSRVFGDRPFALVGASPGGFGTILAQNGWLPVVRPASRSR